MFNLMKESMREISVDSIKFNRRQETKTITSKLIDPSKFKIVEKSGYIGLDYEAAPGLNKMNTWDTLSPQDGKRIVFYNASSFARIYLNNDKFVQYNFSIAVPVYISLDPYYEEMNSDYTSVKDRINKSLEDNIGPVIEKYREDVVVR
jgi:hypothetical protein